MKLSSNKIELGLFSETMYVCKKKEKENGRLFLFKHFLADFQLIFFKQTFDNFFHSFVFFVYSMESQRFSRSFLFLVEKNSGIFFFETKDRNETSGVKEFRIQNFFRNLLFSSKEYFNDFGFGFHWQRQTFSDTDENWQFKFLFHLKQNDLLALITITNLGYRKTKMFMKLNKTKTKNEKISEQNDWMNEKNTPEQCWYVSHTHTHRFRMKLVLGNKYFVILFKIRFVLLFFLLPGFLFFGKSMLPKIETKINEICLKISKQKKNKTIFKNFKPKRYADIRLILIFRNQIDNRYQSVNGSVPSKNNNKKW